MNNIESARWQIKPQIWFSDFLDFEDAFAYLEDFDVTDIAVNEVTKIGGYVGVASTSTTIDIDYSSRQTRITVAIYMECDRELVIHSPDVIECR